MYFIDSFDWFLKITTANIIYVIAEKQIIYCNNFKMSYLKKLQ